MPWFPTRAVSVVSWMPKLTPVMVSGARPLAGAFAGVERVMTAASYEKPSLRVPVMPPTTTYTGVSSQSIAAVTHRCVLARTFARQCNARLHGEFGASAGVRDARDARGGEPCDG